LGDWLEVSNFPATARNAIRTVLLTLPMWAPVILAPRCLRCELFERQVALMLKDEAGADVRITDSSGKTASSYAPSGWAELLER